MDQPEATGAERQPVQINWGSHLIKVAASLERQNYLRLKLCELAKSSLGMFAWVSAAISSLGQKLDGSVGNEVRLRRASRDVNSVHEIETLYLICQFVI